MKLTDFIKSSQYLDLSDVKYFCINVDSYTFLHEPLDDFWKENTKYYDESKPSDKNKQFEFPVAVLIPIRKPSKSKNKYKFEYSYDSILATKSKKLLAAIHDIYFRRIETNESSEEYTPKLQHCVWKVVRFGLGWRATFDVELAYVLEPDGSDLKV